MRETLNYIIAALSLPGSTYLQAQNKETTHFIPDGYSLFKEYTGELNNDGLEDSVLIVKNTKKENVIIDRGEEVDRNRRGIIVLFNKEDHYELVAENLNCFSSENEDGGV
ncbi:hypothetical protein [Salinimicrobium xinjiangense]|uniref:hypothetical protein n=1 Tax=Salinimicrobium xinjiangense TaxID=438596 RepID=UPI00041338E1|nr:hypothetical protein [Salinimicrobium xinjiangense]